MHTLLAVLIHVLGCEAIFSRFISIHRIPHNGHKQKKNCIQNQVFHMLFHCFFLLFAIIIISFETVRRSIALMLIYLAETAAAAGIE